MSKPLRPDREPWFVIRRDLSPIRAAILTTVSFLLPLTILVRNQLHAVHLAP